MARFQQTNLPTELSDCFPLHKDRDRKELFKAADWQIGHTLIVKKFRRLSDNGSQPDS